MARLNRLRTAPAAPAAPARMPRDVRLMNAVFALIVTGLVGALGAAGVLWLTRAPTFTLHAIEVQGTLTRSQLPTLRTHALPELAGNFFSIDLAEAVPAGIDLLFLRPTEGLPARLAHFGFPPVAARDPSRFDVPGVRFARRGGGHPLPGVRRKPRPEQARPGAGAGARADA